MIAMDIALGETSSTVDEESALEDSDEENMPAHISAVLAANEAATAAHQVLYNARNQAIASGSPQDAAAAEAASQQAQAADAALEAADAVAAAYSAAAAPPS
jgi:malonyl CoA-acyl carrier protein transacylase